MVRVCALYGEGVCVLVGGRIWQFSSHLASYTFVFTDSVNELATCIL